jgi:hypothetical protein
MSKPEPDTQRDVTVSPLAEPPPPQAQPLRVLFVPPTYTYACGPGYFKRHETAEEFDLGVTAGLWGPRESALVVTEDVKEAIRGICLDGVPKAEGGPVPPTPAPLDGWVSFDGLGKDDNARTSAMNRLFGERRNCVVVLPIREIQTSVQIELWSGTAIMGSLGIPPREYGRKTRWRYTGSAGAVFKWVNNSAGQSYPADGSPRDGSVTGIEFVGGGSVNILPPTTTIPGKTLWYWLFHNIGMNGMRTAWVGFGTGTVFGSGVSHFQGFSQTAIDVGGSECSLFGGEFSFIDSKNLAAGQPFIRSRLEKSHINTIMTTTRGSYLPLEIAGGRGLHVRGVCFDAQDSAPTDGPAIVVLNHDGLIIDGNDFKGMARTGGPIIDIRGGRQIVIQSNVFINKAAGPASTPLVKVAAAVGDAQVKMGANAVVDYTGRVLSARAAQLVRIDPSFKYEIG